MRLLISVLVFSFLLSNNLFAQVIPGELIVMLKPGKDINKWILIDSRDTKRFPTTQLRLKRTLSRKMNLHLCTFPERTPGIVSQINYDASVIAAQFNYRVKNRDREIPDDPSFDQQWGLETIMAPEAWSVTSGGITPQGDTIVVAVLETGCDVTHEDLMESTWKNYNEIPGDGIDNDNNGYIDDFTGWNLNTNNDQHPSDFHGTSINGILGAKGDNGIGVSGVSWDIKRMVLTYESDLAEILEGYAYAKMMRELYNTTNGAKGAFVVATNSSFGINQARPDDFPVWCAIYDSLGAVGILSAVAPPNMDINVEVIGDMPSRCTSEFVIATTNTNQADEKVLQAGWGKVSIDIGSPGDNSFTTRPNNEYGNFGGTSSSVPHLAGAIALLYSIPEPDFASDSKSNPVRVARLIKTLLLEGVDPLPSLENKTLTGGRLNIYNSMAILLGLEGNGASLDFTSIYPNPSRGLVTLLVENNEEPFTLEIFNATGQKVNDAKEIDSPFSFNRIDLNLSFLKPGVYLLKLESESNKEVRKIIIY